MLSKAQPQPIAKQIQAIMAKRANRPPIGRIRKLYRPDFTDRKTFAAFHRQQLALTRKYLNDAHSNYQTVSHAVAAEIDGGGYEVGLHANNVEGRIHFTEVAVRQILTSEIAKTKQLFMVTIALVQHAVPFEHAGHFDILPLQQFARQALQGMPFVGMVEAALYTRTHGIIAGQLFFVSWHVHLIVWGVERKAIKLALKPLGEKHCNVLDKQPYDIRAIKPGDLEEKLVYILKAPQKEYGIIPANGTPGRMTDRNSKQSIRQGNRVRMCRVLEERLIDKMFFGNGDGTPIVNRIRAEALDGFKAWARRHNRLHHRPGRSLPYPAAGL